MATASGKKDIYANLYTGSVTESAAATLTFDEIDLGLNVFDKVGILINAIEVDLTSFYQTADASGERVKLGMSQSNGFAAADMEEKSIIWWQAPYLKFVGTPATAHWLESIWRWDLSTYPGGGLLVTPRPLYFFAEGVAVASAMTFDYRFFFTVVKLAPDEYFELLEFRQYFG